MISSGFFCGLSHSGSAFNRTDEAFIPLVGSLVAANNFHDLIAYKGIKGKSWSIFQGASFHDCSRSNFFKHFVQWLNQTSEASAGNTSIIYLSGHGAFVAEKYVILASDTNPSCVFETGIPLFSIYHLLREQQKFHRDFVLVLDACCKDFTGVFSDRLPKNVSVFFTAGEDTLSFQTQDGTVFSRDFANTLSTCFPPANVDAREINLVDVLLDVAKVSSQKSFFFVSNVYKPVLHVSNALSRVVHKASGLTISLRIPFSSDTERHRISEEMAFVCAMVGLDLGEGGLTQREGKNEVVYQLPEILSASSSIILLRELSKLRSGRLVNQISVDWSDEVNDSEVIPYVETWTDFQRNEIDEAILTCALFVRDGPKPDVFINSRFRPGGYSLTGFTKKRLMGKTETVKIGVLRFPEPILLKIKATVIALANLDPSTSAPTEEVT